MIEPLATPLVRSLALPLFRQGGGGRPRMLTLDILSVVTALTIEIGGVQTALTI